VYLNKINVLKTDLENKMNNLQDISSAMGIVI